MKHVDVGFMKSLPWRTFVRLAVAEWSKVASSCAEEGSLHRAAAIERASVGTVVDVEVGRLVVPTDFEEEPQPTRTDRRTQMNMRRLMPTERSSAHGLLLPSPNSGHRGGRE